MNLFKSHDMEIKIVKADVYDAEMISLIGKISFRKEFEHFFSKKENLDAYLRQVYNPGKITASIRKENNVYLVAVMDERPVGFAKVKKHSLNDQIEANFQMELQKLYVFPGYQGKGVGRALMKEVKRMAIEIYPDYIWLDTYISNERAIRFYERNGFEITGEDYFTIGNQTFEYKLMAWPVALRKSIAC